MQQGLHRESMPQVVQARTMICAWSSQTDLTRQRIEDAVHSATIEPATGIGDEDKARTLRPERLLATAQVLGEYGDRGRVDRHQP